MKSFKRKVSILIPMKEDFELKATFIKGVLDTNGYPVNKRK